MKNKIPAYSFLKALGLTDKKIICSIKNKSYTEALVRHEKNSEAIITISEIMLQKEVNALRTQKSKRKNPINM